MGCQRNLLTSLGLSVVGLAWPQVVNAVSNSNSGAVASPSDNSDSTISVDSRAVPDTRGSLVISFCTRGLDSSSTLGLSSQGFELRDCPSELSPDDGTAELTGTSGSIGRSHLNCRSGVHSNSCGSMSITAVN